MWKSLLTFAVAALLTTPVFAQAEGKWTGKIPGPLGGSVTYECTVEGYKLTGTMTFGDERPVEISDGSMIGPQVSFLTTRDGLTDRNTGDVKGDELTLRRDRVFVPPRSPDAPRILTTPIILKRVQ